MKKKPPVRVRVRRHVVAALEAAVPSEGPELRSEAVARELGMVGPPDWELAERVAQLEHQLSLVRAALREWRDGTNQWRAENTLWRLMGILEVE